MTHKEQKITNVRLMCGEVHSISAVYVDGKPVKVLAMNDPPGTVTFSQSVEKECDNFCEQCGDCLDCYSDAHEDGCSNI